MLELELNSSGTLTFEIAPDHYYYDNIKKRKSVIKVFQDDELIFFGSPLDEVAADNTIKTITVEGALSWLNDTVQPYAEYHDISVEDYLQTLITNHNNQVSSFKQFALGSVTVTDSNDSLYRYTNFEKTKDCISDDLISSLGGYIKARHEDGINYIDYTESSGSINSQGVRFGFNLISCTKDLKSSTTATAIIPLGAKLNDDSDERLTIADLNDGVIYVYDEDSVEEFDWIYNTVTFDDVTTAAALLTKGYSELATRKYLSGIYTINAIDMSLLDGNYQSIRIGNYIPIVSEKHGVDDYMTVSKMSIDICDPTQSTLTIGSEFTTLTDNTRYSDKVVNTIVSDYVKNEQLTEVKDLTVYNSSAINQTASEIESVVNSQTQLGEDITELSETVATQTSEFFQWQTTSTETTDDLTNALNAEIATRTSQLRFEDGELSIGETGNNAKTYITPEGMIIRYNGEVTAQALYDWFIAQNLNVVNEFTQCGFTSKPHGTIGNVGLMKG